MKTFVVFQALDNAALDCLVDWRKSRTLDPAAFTRQRFGLVYHLTLPYAWQRMPPVERDMIAVQIETGDVVALDGWDCQSLGHVYALLGHPALAELDPTSDAVPLYIEPGHDVLARAALSKVMPSEVVATCLRDDGVLPVFLTPKSLVRLAVHTMIMLGDIARNGSTGVVKETRSGLTFASVFPAITPIPA